MPHEVTLVRHTLVERFTDATPERLIDNKVYDSEPLDKALREQGVKLNCPLQVEPEEASDARRALLAPAQAELDSREVVCVVAKLSSPSGALRVS